MKKLFVTIALLMATISFGFSQSAKSENVSKNVVFSVKNNSALPHSYTVVSYEQGQNGNSTSGFMVGSYGTRTLTFPIGTKVYLADKKQVDVVMSGKRITDDKPFLIVSADNAGKTIDLR